MDKEEEEAGKGSRHVFGGSGRLLSLAFTSVWHPSIQRRNRSTSGRRPTKAAGLVWVVHSPHAHSQKKVTERAGLMTKTSMVCSTLPLSHHQRTQVRAALWIPSSHVTRSALGGHIKDSTRYTHWHYHEKFSGVWVRMTCRHNLVLKCNLFPDKRKCTVLQKGSTMKSWHLNMIRLDKFEKKKPIIIISQRQLIEAWAQWLSEV